MATRNPPPIVEDRRNGGDPANADSLGTNSSPVKEEAQGPIPIVRQGDVRSSARGLEDIRDEMRASDMTREERSQDDPDDLELLQQLWLNNRLPDPPRKPGFHRLWASRTNTQTPVSYFERLGYRFVDPSEWKGLDGGVSANSAAEPGNVISVNEMVLMEIPERTYQRFMRAVHHDAPLAEERSIVENMKDAMVDVTGKNMRREVGDGTALMGRAPGKTPEFT